MTLKALCTKKLDKLIKLIQLNGWNRMNVYEEIIKIMKQKNLNKEAVIDVLNLYVNGRNFLRHLEDLKNKEGVRQEYNGVIYSEEYESDDKEYYGQSKVLFYSGHGY